MDSDDGGPFSLTQSLTEGGAYSTTSPGVSSQYHVWGAAATSTSLSSTTSTTLPTHFSPVSPTGHGLYNDHLSLHSSQSAVDVLSVRLGQADYHSTSTDRLTQGDGYHENGSTDNVSRHPAGQPDYHDHLVTQERHLGLETYHHMSASSSSSSSSTQQQERLASSDYHSNQSAERLAQNDYHSTQQTSRLSRGDYHSSQTSDHLGQTDYRGSQQSDRLGQNDYHAAQTSDRLAQADYHLPSQTDRLGQLDYSNSQGDRLQNSLNKDYHGLGGDQVVQHSSSYHAGQGGQQAGSFHTASTVDRALGAQADYHSTQVDLEAVSMHADFERRQLDVSLLPKDLVDTGQRGSTMDYLTSQTSRDSLAGLHPDIMGLQREIDLSMGQTIPMPQRSVPGDLASTSYGLDPASLQRDLSPYNQRDLDRAMLSASDVVGQVTDGGGHGSNTVLHPQDLAGINLTAAQRDLVDLTTLARSGSGRDDLGRVRDVMHRPRNEIQRALELEVLGSLDNSTASVDLTLNGGSSTKSSSRVYPSARLPSAVKRQNGVAPQASDVRLPNPLSAIAANANGNGSLNFFSLPSSRDPLNIMGMADPITATSSSRHNATDFTRQQTSQGSRLRRELTAPYPDLALHHSMLTSATTLPVPTFKTSVDQVFSAHGDLICNDALTSSRERLYEMMKQHQFCDAVLGTSLHSIKVHKAVLCSASAYLCGVLSQTCMGKSGGRILTVQFKADIPASSLSAFIDYIYHGKIKLVTKSVRDLNVMARCLHMECLKKTSEEMLVSMGTFNDADITIPELILLETLVDKLDKEVTASLPLPPTSPPPSCDVGVSTDTPLPPCQVDQSAQTEDTPASCGCLSGAMDLRSGGSCVRLGGLGTLSLVVKGGVSVGDEADKAVELNHSVSENAGFSFPVAKPHHKKHIAPQACRAKSESASVLPVSSSSSSLTSSFSSSLSSSLSLPSSAASAFSTTTTTAVTTTSSNERLSFDTELQANRGGPCPAIPASSSQSNPTPSSNTNPNPTPTSHTNHSPTPSSHTNPNPTPTSHTNHNPTPSSHTNSNPTPTSHTNPTLTSIPLTKPCKARKRTSTPTSSISPSFPSMSSQPVLPGQTARPVYHSYGTRAATRTPTKQLESNPYQPLAACKSGVCVKGGGSDIDVKDATVDSSCEDKIQMAKHRGRTKKGRIAAALSEALKHSELTLDSAPKTEVVSGFSDQTVGGEGEKTVLSVGTTTVQVGSSLSLDTVPTSTMTTTTANTMTANTTTANSTTGTTSNPASTVTEAKSCAPRAYRKRLIQSLAISQLLQGKGAPTHSEVDLDCSSWCPVGGEQVKHQGLIEDNAAGSSELIGEGEVKGEQLRDMLHSPVPTKRKKKGKTRRMLLSSPSSSGGVRVRAPPKKRAKMELELEQLMREEMEEEEEEEEVGVGVGGRVTPKREQGDGPGGHSGDTESSDQQGTPGAVVMIKMPSAKPGKKPRWIKKDQMADLLIQLNQRVAGVGEGTCVFVCLLCNNRFLLPKRCVSHVLHTHKVSRAEALDHVKVRAREDGDSYPDDMAVDHDLVCDTCGYRSRENTTYYLHYHKYFKHGVPLPKGWSVYTCDLCGKELFTKFQLKDHKRTHLEKTPFVCDVCGSGFQSRSNLHSHVLHRHSAEKKHCCDKCDRTFKTRTQLSVHLRTHSGVRPFSCTECPYRSTTRGNMRLHLINRHKLPNTQASDIMRDMKPDFDVSLRSVLQQTSSDSGGEKKSPSKKKLTSNGSSTKIKQEKDGSASSEQSSNPSFSSCKPSESVDPSSMEVFLRAATGHNLSSANPLPGHPPGHSTPPDKAGDTADAETGQPSEVAVVLGGEGDSSLVTLQAADPFPASHGMGVCGDAGTVTFLHPGLESMFQATGSGDLSLTPAVSSTGATTILVPENFLLHHPPSLLPPAHKPLYAQPQPHFTSFVMGTAPTLQTFTSGDLVVSATPLNTDSLKTEEGGGGGMMDLGDVGVGMGVVEVDRTLRQGVLNSDLKFEPSSSSSDTQQNPASSPSQSSGRLCMQHSPISPPPPTSPAPVYVAVTPTPHPLSLAVVKQGERQEVGGSTVVSTAAVGGVLVESLPQGQTLHQYDASLLHTYYPGPFYQQ